MPPDIDDGSIPDAAGLLRRIHPDFVFHDKNRGRWRPMSGAFLDKEMSVDAEPILHEHGLDLTFSLRNYPGFSLARFRAGEARARGLSVMHKPLPDNPAHTHVIGITQATARHFAITCEWAHLEPPGEEPPS
jgi:hypothetical protein